MEHEAYRSDVESTGGIPTEGFSDDLASWTPSRKSQQKKMGAPLEAETDKDHK